jgi:hypothetical protein
VSISPPRAHIGSASRRAARQPRLESVSPDRVDPPTVHCAFGGDGYGIFDDAGGLMASYGTGLFALM